MLRIAGALHPAGAQHVLDHLQRPVRTTADVGATKLTFPGQVQPPPFPPFPPWPLHPPVRPRRLPCPPPSLATLVQCGALRGPQPGGCSRRRAPTRASGCGRPPRACSTAPVRWQAAASTVARDGEKVQMLRSRGRAMRQRGRRRRAGLAYLRLAGMSFPGRSGAWRGTQMDGTAGQIVGVGDAERLLGRFPWDVGFCLLVLCLAVMSDVTMVLVYAFFFCCRVDH